MNAFESQPQIVADIVMLAPGDGGRKTGIRIDPDARYMPHLVVEDRTNRTSKRDANGYSTEHYMGVLFEPALSIADPSTGSGIYPLRLMYFPAVNYDSLVTGATFTVREGGRIVGHGVVTEREPLRAGCG